MTEEGNSQNHPSAQTQRLSPEEEKARGRRNVAIAVSLVAFAVLVFIITVINLQQGIMERPL